VEYNIFNHVSVKKRVYHRKLPISLCVDAIILMQVVEQEANQGKNVGASWLVKDDLEYPVGR
jgi:hypothetical protein